MNLDFQFVKRTEENSYDGRVGVYLSLFDKQEYCYPLVYCGNFQKIKLKDYPEYIHPQIDNLLKNKPFATLILGLTEEDILQIPGDLIRSVDVIHYENFTSDQLITMIVSKYNEYLQVYSKQLMKEKSRNDKRKLSPDIAMKIISLFDEKTKLQGHCAFKPWAIASLVDKMEYDPEIVLYQIELLKEANVLKEYSNGYLILNPEIPWGNNQSPPI